MHETGVVPLFVHAVSYHCLYETDLVLLLSYQYKRHKAIPAEGQYRHHCGNLVPQRHSSRTSFPCLGELPYASRNLGMTTETH